MRRCGSCNRPLHDPRSVERGFGPSCWERLDHRVRAVVPAPDPRPPRRCDSAVAVIGSWLVGLMLVLAVVLFWRWLVFGLGFLGATAATGLLIEHLQERRPSPVAAPRLAAAAREADEVATTMGAPAVSTSPSGAV